MEWVSGCYLMPNELFFSLYYETNVIFSWNDDDNYFVLDKHTMPDFFFSVGYFVLDKHAKPNLIFLVLDTLY
jgi:hypothetical protein